MSAAHFLKPPANNLHAEFLLLLPRLVTQARYRFRSVWCLDARDDRIADCLALAWQWFVRLKERGKDVALFPAVFASFVARAVYSGRRIGGGESSRDTLSQRAQHRHGFQVEALPHSTAATHEVLHAQPHGQRRHDAFEERLRDNQATPPDEQAMFRIDFQAWLTSLTVRERSIVEAMSTDERTCELAKRFQLSPGRISQLRKEFAENWQRYCDGAEPAQGR